MPTSHFHHLSVQIFRISGCPLKVSLVFSDFLHGVRDHNVGKVMVLDIFEKSGYPKFGQNGPHLVKNEVFVLKPKI